MATAFSLLPNLRTRPFRVGALSVALLTTAVFSLPAQASAATAKTAKQIAAGDSHACALLSDATVTCWGSNYYGQLGDATTTDRNRPGTVLGISSATKIASGGDFSCALITGGTVKCWGDNEYNQVGSQSGSGKNIAATAIQVVGITAATDVAAGYRHACVRITDGSVKCWGYNGSGQLGTGSASDSGSYTPTSVAGLTGVTQITAGEDHTCAVVAAGAVKCWGSNSFGQLGDATNDDHLTPTAVSGITGASAVSARHATTCALVSGAVKCWGSKLGPVAFGSPRKTNTPVAIAGISGATQLSVGYDHACVVAAKAAVLCWGGNSTGQLGDGSTSGNRTPTKVGTLAGSSIAAGYGFSCTALTASGISCWGSDQDGELGNGRNTDSLYPSVVAFGAPPAPPVISAGPGDWINSSSVSISFTAATDKSFTCSIDGASFRACKSPLKLTKLADGDHTLTIRHATKTGEESTVTTNWSVDTVKPTLSSTQVTGAVAGGQTSFDLLERPDDSFVVSAEYSTATKTPSATAKPVASRTVEWKSPLVIAAVGIKFLRIGDAAGNWSAWYAVSQSA